MLAQSHHGGRAELGQNFLTHQPTLVRIAELVATTKGSILEIGVGGCALTKHLCTLGRDLRAIDIDASRVKRLQAELKGVDIAHADVRREPLTRDVVVGNIPFHLTTPIMRRLLAEGDWTHAIVLTQWEVARKRAGVGGSTMMTSQAAPWFSFELHDR
ncbi:PREDICTED: rRNA adenine N-6-methyltransferase-like, partial [Cyphomyrmex costatus]|uniref:rRNA adenine N-6-methyltransferase-like n=1 Tax=Cyphomyrmex costatus TaxID=456900 RepID=UPI0008522874